MNQIQELQPDACLVLEANLHMTEEKSEGDAIFNNENINEMNDAIHHLAEEKNLGWLDVNELFDDENGNLNADLSADGAHILGKYLCRLVRLDFTEIAATGCKIIGKSVIIELSYGRI